MGTIAEKLQVLLNSKTAIKKALQNKGKSPTDVLSTYAGLIDELDNTSDGRELAEPQPITATTKSRKGSAYGNGIFVAISANASSTTGLLEYSTDGITWTEADLPKAAMWNAVAFGNGKFVAVASSNSNAVIYSTDGKSWTETTLPSSGSWLDVTYGTDKFVAVKSGSNEGAYSADGITWTAMTMPATTTWRSVIFGKGIFVAVAFAGITAYSTDGITWTQGGDCLTGRWGVVCGNGKFVAVGAAGYSYSTDGSTWMNVAEDDNCTAIAFGKGMFIRTMYPQDYAYYSVDGTDWKRCIHGATTQINRITYGDGKFIAVCGNAIICIPILANPTSKEITVETQQIPYAPCAWEKYYVDGENLVFKGFVLSERTTTFPEDAVQNGYHYKRVYPESQITYLLTTNGGDTYAQLASKEQVALTATADDISQGKTAITEKGLTTGTKNT